MGRHGAPRSNPGRWVAVAVVVLIALGGGAAVAAKVMADDGFDPSSTQTSSTTPSATAAGGSAPSATMEATAVQALADATLASCREEVKAGEALVTAAQASARDWRAHTAAQLELDQRKITFAQAEARWKASKKFAVADLANFRKLNLNYLRYGGSGCVNTVKATQGTNRQAAGAACAARAQALAKVHQTGDKINDQWYYHVVQMGNKARDAGPAYHKQWLTYVAQSKPAFAAYDAALAAFQKAPACPST